MPIGQKAVTPAFPKSQNDPRSKSNEQRNQVEFSQFGMKPTEQIEKNQYRVEYIEKDVGYMKEKITHVAT